MRSSGICSRNVPVTKQAFSARPLHLGTASVLDMIVLIVQLFFLMVDHFGRSLASNLLWLHRENHLILHWLSLVDDLWYQMDDIASLISRLTHHGLSSCNHIFRLLFNFDIAEQLLLPFAFALTERSGRSRGGQALQRWTRWYLTGRSHGNGFLDGH